MTPMLFGKTRLAVLSLLYNRVDESLYLRQIARATRAGLGAVQRELAALAEAGIILRTVHNRRVYYRANPECPVFAELKNLVAKIAVNNMTSPASAKTMTRTKGQQNIVIPKDKIADFCKHHHVRKLSLFGSVLRDDFRPDSDIDVLVEFEPGHVPGLAFFGMEAELSEVLGRKVDLNTAGFLSRYFRDQVIKEARVQYAEP